MSGQLRVVLASTRAEGLELLADACHSAGHIPVACVAASEAAAAAEIVLNIHTSILPRHRGPMPVHWALLMGGREIGVTIHWMDDRFDSGPIMAQRTGIDLVDEMDDRAADALIEELGHITHELVPTAVNKAAAGIPGVPQDEEYATYEGPIDSELSTIDWSRNAGEVHNQVRARRFGVYDPPGPVAEVNGRQISVLRTSSTPADGLRVNCADQSLWITDLIYLTHGRVVLKCP
ncbi:methionyl-tRNA formyltransferase [Nocardia rhamnosiphila]